MGPPIIRFPLISAVATAPSTDIPGRESRSGYLSGSRTKELAYRGVMNGVGALHVIAYVKSGEGSSRREVSMAKVLASYYSVVGYSLPIDPDIR